MAYSLWNHTANQDCQPIRMFLIFLEIHAQFRLTWTPTHTSEWRVIRCRWMLTSGEQLAQMHGLAEWTEVTVLSDLTRDLSCSKFRPIEVTSGWNQVEDMQPEKGSLHLWEPLSPKNDMCKICKPCKREGYNMTTGTKMIQSSYWSWPHSVQWAGPLVQLQQKGFSCCSCIESSRQQLAL